MRAAAKTAGERTTGVSGHVSSSVVLLGAVVLAGVLPGAARADTRFALIVGHNQGNLHETPLRWAESDATRLRQVLIEIGNLRPDRAHLLLSPTVQQFEKARLTMEGRLQEAKHRGERTIFIVYFSGHADQEELHFGTEQLDLAKLELDLKAGAAETVLTIIDACRNDRNPRVKTKGATRTPAFSWPLQEPSAPSGYVRLSSAAAGEVAQESDDLQGSLFTHHLLSGMRGSADLDQDGTVTLDELYRYGYARTLEETHLRTHSVQHSELEVALSGQNALIVTYPRRAESTLEFGQTVTGHLLIIDDRSGRIVAEVHRDRASSSRVAVPPGRYRIQMRGTDEIRSGLVVLSDGNRIVELSELSPQPALAVLTKGSSYDPHPYVLSLGTVVGTPVMKGFGVTPALLLGFDYRISPGLRIGARVRTGYTGADGPLWQHRQLEIGAEAVVDYAAFFVKEVALVVGLRAGAIAAFQRSDRQDAARLQAGNIDDTERAGQGVGPLVGAIVGLEYHPWAQVGFRLEGEPSVWWLQADGNTEARLGAVGSLSLLVRL